MQKEISSIKSTLSTLVEDNYIFNIPIYQRLYVWKSEQIKTLLDDLCHSFNRKDKDYYLGGIMITQNRHFENEIFKMFDVIDGQQRFTTLWLVSRILLGDLDRFKNYTIDNELKSRLSFSVRDFANHFFSDSDSTFSDEEERELALLRSGIKTIEAYFNNSNSPVGKEKYVEFSRFIFQNVFFIVTKMPDDIDENKIFEAMNNRGVQLQQHEILKSQILKHITCVSSRRKYSLIWDACSQMDIFLEKSIKDVASLKWQQLFKLENEDSIVKLPDNILNCLDSLSTSETEINLAHIVKNDNITDVEKLILQSQLAEDEAYESSNVRSIIGFPLLLLHTLRIYQKRRKGITSELQIAEVNAKELNTIFNRNYSLSEYERLYMIDSEEDALFFMNLLWKVREAFDCFVIKWVSVDDGGKVDDYHQILTLYQTKTAFQRRNTKALNELALLQSMLYHSQQLITHYWLTPFLNFIIDESDLSKVLRYLKRLDNEMFCKPRRDLRTSSYHLMSLEGDKMKGEASYVESELRKALGVSFPHYYFYKLEFILWSKRNELSAKYNLKLTNSEMWDEFYLTSRNSIEHIFPQNPKAENSNLLFIIADEKRDALLESDEHYSPINDFGNLVLLTTGMNSSYSNKSFGEKRQQFINNKRRIDSLKSSIIFSQEIWNWESVQNHRDSMITIFKDYLNTV